MTSTQFIPGNIPAGDRRWFQNPIPTAYEAEMCIVGCFLIEPERSFNELARVGFRRKHFHSKYTLGVFDMCLEAYKTGDVDLVALRQMMKDRSKLMEYGERLELCAYSVPSALNCQIYARIVIKKWECTQLMKLAITIARRLHSGSDPQDIREGIQKWLSKQKESTPSPSTLNGHQP